MKTEWKKYFLCVLAAVLWVFIINCRSEAAPGEGTAEIKGEYLGQKPPGLVPEIFGRDIPWFENKFVQDIAISPDGKEICYVECNGGDQWNNFTIMYTRRDTNGYWSKPVRAPFMGSLKNGFRPFFSPDGNRVYFVGEPMPRNIYMSVRATTGWTEPVALDAPINSDTIEHSFSVNSDGSVFFCSHRSGKSRHCDIFSARVAGEKFGGIKSEETLNTKYADCGPVLSKDGGFLVFHSTRSGSPDLFVARRNAEGEWEKPVRMGGGINTPMLEVIPHFSPDGKYLFFTRRKNFTTSEPSRLYWVSTKILQ